MNSRTRATSVTRSYCRGVSVGRRRMRVRGYAPIRWTSHTGSNLFRVPPVRLSAVVPATDGAVTLDRCLAAILAADEPPDEIVVVRAPGMPPAIGPGVVSADSPAFGGPAAARNAGAAIATGDVLVFVDADVAVRPDAFVRCAIAVRRRGRGRGVRLVLRPARRGRGRVRLPQPAPPPRPPGGRGAGRDVLDRARRDPARRCCSRSAGWTTGCGTSRTSSSGAGWSRRGASIVLDPTMQGTHLKGYTLRAMVRTDLHERAIPWVRLALEGRATTRALNAAGATGRARRRRSRSLLGALPRRPRVGRRRRGAMLAPQPPLLRAARATARRPRRAARARPARRAPPHRAERHPPGGASSTRRRASASPPIVAPIEPVGVPGGASPSRSRRVA